MQYKLYNEDCLDVLPRLENRSKWHIDNDKWELIKKNIWEYFKIV